MPIVSRSCLPALILALAAPLPSAWAEQAPNTLSEAEKRAGWKLLFDGTKPDAFRSYRQESLNAGWQVRDGALVRAARGAGDIVTRDQFEAFELQLEYRIAPGGNSGIMFHVTEEEDAPWKTGPEVQVLDNAAGKDPQKAGWLYQLYAPRVPDWVRKIEEAVGRKPPEHLDATRPAGEWNHVSLRVAPGDGEVAVNGVVYERFQKGSKDWHERVAKSKFAAFPKFGRADRGHVCLQDHGDEVAYRSIKVRPLPADGAAIPFADGTAAVAAVPAFPEATWEGWSPESEDGTPVVPLRPVVVTHAGDGSGRRFVLDQAGMIHVFKPGSVAGSLFLDLRPGTSPWGTYNEEGLLGLAFHPRFKENGTFFVTYSVKGEKRAERLARFKVSRTDPDRADPASEELVLVVDQPFWNHNGGSITFGPDGFLYWGLGDGGSRDDPFGNGQRLDTLLGKILRIDVDRRDEGRAYAIPADNPFVGRANARGEIFALGFRNPWQIAFDAATGALWAADVGQDQWEEVDIVTKGGNYGWSVREGTRPFGNRPEVAGPLVDPVWEYDHRVGKSIVGGFVYRGKAIPELVGGYLYGDYVSGRLWALQIDKATGRATNLAIPWNGLPIFGFGADADGEAYVLTSSPTGQGVFRLAPATKAVAASRAEDKPVSGVYFATKVASSPQFIAKGMAWWNGRLIIVNREPAQLHAFTPPDRFEIFKEQGLTNPFGVAVDPQGRLLFTENQDDVLYRLARLTADGKEETLLEERGVNHRNKHSETGLCTPLMLATHPNGTIYWSGYPSTGTRYLLPGKKDFTLADVKIAKPHVGHSHGIGLSPDHDWLYVASQFPNPANRGVWRFPVKDDGSLGEGTFFIAVDRFTTSHFKDLPAAKDGSDKLLGWLGRIHGLAVDANGYIYIGGSDGHSSGSAVAVFTPDGKTLAAMIVGDPSMDAGMPTNVYGLAFGGADGRTLFISGKGKYRLSQVTLPVAGEVVSRTQGNRP